MDLRAAYLDQGGTNMTAAQIKRTGTNRLVDTVEEAEHTSLEAVRKFVDTVDSRSEERL